MEQLHAEKGMGDAGRELRQPMGVVSIGGLIVSTLLTLLVVPAVYNLFLKNAKCKGVGKRKNQR